MDNINEKLFDEFGDVVLENNEQDQPQVITDYVDDLKDMFLKGWNHATKKKRTKKNCANCP